MASRARDDRHSAHAGPRMTIFRASGAHVPKQAVLRVPKDRHFRLDLNEMATIPVCADGNQFRRSGLERHLTAGFSAYSTPECDGPTIMTRNESKMTLTISRRALTRAAAWMLAPVEIGRASCRERVCQYV